MRPRLMIEKVKNLHDARYCAAVGISLVSFQLDPADADALTPHAVREMVEWLSGLEIVACMGNISPSEINATAEAAQVDWVQIPLDYDLALALAIEAKLVFSIPNQASYGSLTLLEAHRRFPEALFLFAFESSEILKELESHPSLLERCVLRIDDTDAIFRHLQSNGLQPYGFSLGNFAADQDGILDYDACDEFLEQYQAMELA